MQSWSAGKQRLGLVVLALAALLTIGMMGLGQGWGGWEEIVAGLRAHPSGPEAAELAKQAILLCGGGDGPALLEQLAPERVAVYCVDPDCLRIVVVIPARTLRAGEEEWVYNRDGVLGLLGTFGGSIVPELEGFFRLVSNPDGSVSLIGRWGERAAALLGAQVHRLAVAPQPIPLPRPAESSPLSLEVTGMGIELGPLSVEMGLGADHTVQIMLGQFARNGTFSGVLMFGATPQPIPLP